MTDRQTDRQTDKQILPLFWKAEPFSFVRFHWKCHLMKFISSEVHWREREKRGRERRREGERERRREGEREREAEDERETEREREKQRMRKEGKERERVTEVREELTYCQLGMSSTTQHCSRL